MGRRFTFYLVFFSFHFSVYLELYCIFHFLIFAFAMCFSCIRREKIETIIWRGLAGLKRGDINKFLRFVLAFVGFND